MADSLQVLGDMVYLVRYRTFCLEFHRPSNDLLNIRRFVDELVCSQSILFVLFF